MTQPPGIRCLLDSAVLRLIAAAWLVLVTATYLRLLLTSVLVMHGVELAP
jgi:hypothetical protein